MKEYMHLMTKTKDGKSFGPAAVHKDNVAAYEKDGWVLVNPKREDSKPRQRKEQE